MSNDGRDGADGADETNETRAVSGANTTWKPVLSVGEKKLADYIRSQLLKNGTKSVENPAVQEFFDKSPDPTSPREIIHLALEILASEFTEEL